MHTMYMIVRNDLIRTERVLSVGHVSDGFYDSKIKKI